MPPSSPQERSRRPEKIERTLSTAPPHRAGRNRLTNSSSPLALVLGLAALAAILALACLLAGSPGPAAAWTGLNGGVLAATWMTASWGFGRVLRGALFPSLEHRSAHRTPLALALGVAFMLALDSLLATIGAFGEGVQWPALLLLALGVAAAAWGVRGAWRDARALGPSGAAWRERMLTPWLALPALAALAAAAAVPPGLLWSSEFGGYDALSYHLQVPREWLQMGAAAPLPHNAYSALPSFVESATLHLFAAAQWEDVRNIAVAAQCLHALLAVAAAWVIGSVAASCVAGPGAPRVSLANDRGPALARVTAWCVTLGVPWIVVTGSLAYNEMGVMLAFAGALLAWQCGAAAEWSRRRLGVAIGLMLGAAVGSKLTALGMAVVPAILWTMLAPSEVARRVDRSRARTLLAVGLVAAAVCVIVLMPWLVRTWHATGSPVFPFASGVFGDGWWTSEQVARFASAHHANGGVLARATELWQQGIAYGFGAAPNAFEPWLPQWSVAWWLAAGAFGLVAWRGPRGIALATGAMLVAQLAFWLLATHMKSRFLVPSVVPMAIVIGVCAGAVLACGARPRWTRVALLAALFGWCTSTVVILWRDPAVAPAFAAAESGGFDGVHLGGGPSDVAQRITDPRVAIPLAWALNHTLPREARVATEGEAAVFWCARTPSYGTVWDGGVLARAMRAHGDDPVAVIQWLVDQGYTHLAVNGNMLDVWARAAWLDPAVTAGRVQSVTARLRQVRPFLGMGGGTIFELPRRPVAQ
ncbi:MAG: hypothetical protein JNK53_08035 [Phycisphaerae bacterium]|nr:hypothetical protein [Phycisphaerae bacterium]